MFDEFAPLFGSMKYVSAEDIKKGEFIYLNRAGELISNTDEEDRYLVFHWAIGKAIRDIAKDEIVNFDPKKKEFG
jgi:hypothetical protein